MIWHLSHELSRQVSCGCYIGFPISGRGANFTSTGLEFFNTGVTRGQTTRDTWLTFHPNSFSNTTSLTFIADNPAPDIFQVIANAVEDENSSSEKTNTAFLTRTLLEQIRYVSHM